MRSPRPYKSDESENRPSERPKFNRADRKTSSRLFGEQKRTKLKGEREGCMRVSRAGCEGGDFFGAKDRGEGSLAACAGVLGDTLAFPALPT